MPDSVPMEAAPMERSEFFIHDQYFKYARIALMVMGVFYILVAFVAPALIMVEPPEESEAQSAAFVMVAIAFFVCIVVAALNFVAAWGLGKQHKWAWIIAVILGGLYTPSICFPVGVLILYAILRKDARQAFGL